jgi:hypothetical protein
MAALRQNPPCAPAALASLGRPTGSKARPHRAHGGCSVLNRPRTCLQVQVSISEGRLGPWKLASQGRLDHRALDTLQALHLWAARRRRSTSEVHGPEGPEGASVPWSMTVLVANYCVVRWPRSFEQNFRVAKWIVGRG